MARMTSLRAKPMMILTAQIQSELNEPHVVGETLADPEGARMIRRMLLVAPLSRCLANWGFSTYFGGRAVNVMCRVEHLAVFQNHLDDMFVAVPPRTTTCFSTQEEDIHLWVTFFQEKKKFQFF